MLYPVPSRFCQRTRGPSFGQGAMMPFSAETLVPAGPRKPGQSDPPLRVPRSGNSSGLVEDESSAAAASNSPSGASSAAGGGLTVAWAEGTEVGAGVQPQP